MSKHPIRRPCTPGGSREQPPPRWLLYAWFHPEIVPGLPGFHCHARPGVVRFDDYYPRPSRQEFVSAPLEQAAEQLFTALLAEQVVLGPRVHHSQAVLLCLHQAAPRCDLWRAISARRIPHHRSHAAARGPSRGGGTAGHHERDQYHVDHVGAHPGGSVQTARAALPLMGPLVGRVRSCTVCKQGRISWQTSSLSQQISSL